MSHYYTGRSHQRPLDPTLNHVQHQYNGQVPRLHISTVEQAQQWNPSQRPRSVQDMREQVYSPAISVHTTKTTPDTLLHGRMVYHQPDLSPTNNNVGLSLQSGSSMLSSSYLSPTFNPTAREDSWSLFNLRSTDNKRARHSSHQSKNELPHYGHAESGEKGVLLSDEGYFSVETSQSVIGNEPDRISQGLPADFYNQIEAMNVDCVGSSATAVSRAPSDQRSRVSSTRSRKSTSKWIECSHSGCNETFKCKSEHK
jgi:hypothetical protein